MIVGDFYFKGIAEMPPEADAVLVIHPNAVLAGAVPL